MYRTGGPSNLQLANNILLEVQHIMQILPIKSDSRTYSFLMMGLQLKILKEKENNKYCFVLIPFFFKSFLRIAKAHNVVILH